MRTSPRPIPRSVAGADVGVVVFDHVDRGFLRAGGPAVDPDVGRDEVFLIVGMGGLVLGHQPARPRVRAVVEQQAVDVLVGLVVVLAVFGQLVVQVEGGIGLLLAEQLVERLLLAAVRAGPDNGRPALRRRDAPVEGIVSRFTRLSRQGVGRLLGRVVVEISGFVACLVRHRLLLFGLRDEFALVVSSFHSAAPPARGGIWFAGSVALPVNSGYGAASGSYGALREDGCHRSTGSASSPRSWSRA